MIFSGVFTADQTTKIIEAKRVSWRIKGKVFDPQFSAYQLRELDD